jgi:putative transposase
VMSATPPPPGREASGRPAPPAADRCAPTAEPPIIAASAGAAADGAAETPAQAPRPLQRSDRPRTMAPLVAGRPDTPGSTGRDNRMFVEAVLRVVRTGAPRRDPPAAFGPWNTALRRFGRWAAAGAWERLFAAVSDDPDLEYLILDSTVVRAHRHAAGGKGGCGSGRRPLARRPDHQDPPRRARAGPPGAGRARRGAGR